MSVTCVEYIDRQKERQQEQNLHSCNNYPCQPGSKRWINPAENEEVIERRVLRLSRIMCSHYTIGVLRFSALERTSIGVLRLSGPGAAVFWPATTAAAEGELDGDEL